MARVLGIDPGLAKTGYAVIESNKGEFQILASGVIKTSTSDSLATRIHIIHNNLFNIITQYRPNFASIEETYVNNNYSSSLKLAHARASAILAVMNSGLEITEMSAKTIKKTITGSGSADKIQVEKMINLMLGGKRNFESNDESDAIAIAIATSLSVKA